MRRAPRWIAARSLRNSTPLLPLFQEYKLAQRIGINSGEALVGNFGSRRRFNYSVMSDAVNLASRLEGANKFYGTTVIASETTVALTGDAFAWRELDAIRVKGRIQALKIYELLARAAELTPERRLLIANYAEGLAHWRAREFDRAAASSAARPTSIGRPRCFAIAPSELADSAAGRRLGSDPNAAGEIMPNRSPGAIGPARSRSISDADHQHELPAAPGAGAIHVVPDRADVSIATVIACRGEPNSLRRPVPDVRARARCVCARGFTGADRKSGSRSRRCDR